ncbi:MAG TPA: ribbon-helix-helix domain-containing protein [Pseudolabrys sp.]|nr:ribbon-helix-helix domain-containing protein [Pseudolabrys sp.]
MSTQITKRSVILDGHKTSVSLEDDFWDALRLIAAQKNVKTSKLVAKIAEGRSGKNLSSAIRLFVLNHFRTFDIQTDASPNASISAAKGNKLASRNDDW